jgi:hypothetical protein
MGLWGRRGEGEEGSILMKRVTLCEYFESFSIPGCFGFLIRFSLLGKELE